MTKEELAQRLNGRQYRGEMDKEEETSAKLNELLVVFGASDDLMEFRGIIYDECGAYNGAEAFLVKKRGGKVDIISDNDLEEIEDLMKDKDLDFQIKKVKIEAQWCPEDLDCSWRIKTELPHATFDIFEDNELYCRGLVISKIDIEQALSL